MNQEIYENTSEKKISPRKLSLIQILNIKSNQTKQKLVYSPNRENRSSTSTTGDEILDASFENAHLKISIKSDQLKHNFSNQNNSPIQFQFSEKYKTEICKNFEQTKTCKFGNSCCFAHGEAELRTKIVSNEFYKTKICRHFEQTGFCPYGHRCQYFHFQGNRIYGDILESIFSKVGLGRNAFLGSLEEILSKNDMLLNKKTFEIGLF